MVPPLHPPRDDSERTTPLLPTTGVDAESVMDLPWPVDQSTLPPPPDPVLPPTFSAPSTPLHRDEAPWPEPAEPPSTAPRPVSTTSSLPAPISAGPLSGPAFHDERDPDDAVAVPPAGPDALPPMVAKGGWEPVAGNDHVAGPAASSGADHEGAQPAAPSLIQRLSRSSHSTPPEPAVHAPSGDPHPAAPGQLPPIVAASPPTPTGALAFSPDVGPPQPYAPGPSVVGPVAPVPTPGYSAIQPLSPGPDPRQSRGPAPIVSEPRIGDGLLVAAAAATVAGLIWWAVVAITQRQIPYVAFLLGILVGQATLVGGRRGSIGLGIVASVTSLLALTAAQYFIARSLAISELNIDVPLWDGSSWFFEVIRTTIEDDPITGLFILLAAGVAGVQAGWPGRRASGPLGEMRVTRSPDKIL